MSSKTKICIGCQRLFEARRDAKTCSPRCRKRYQRSKAHHFEDKSAEWHKTSFSYK